MRLPPRNKSGIYGTLGQAPGQVAVYGASDSIWYSGVQATNGPFTLAMLDDGNLVESDNTAHIVWMSNTKR